MKKFSQIISEVAEPRSGDEQRFKAAHVVTKIGHPVALDHQFTGEVKGIGSSARIADRKKGEDEAAYDPSYIEKDKQFKMPRNVDEATDPVNKDELKGKHKDRKDQDIDNDGDVDSSDEYLHKRRQAVSKAISKSLSKKTEASVEESAELEGLEEELSATCGCGSDCDHCGGKHDVGEIGKKCSCCDNMIEPSTTSESVKIDEILDTPKAMQSYDAKNRASYDKAASSAAAKILRGKDKDGNRADHRPELRTMAKRKKGQTMRDMLAVRRTFANLRNEEVELDEATMSRVAKELETYARKSGGIDKMDFMKAAMMMKKGQTAQLKKFVDDLDTEPREKILSLMDKDAARRKEYKAAQKKMREEVVNEGSYERSGYGKGHPFDRGEAHVEAARHHDMEAEKHEKARNFETADLHTAASKAHQKAADYFYRLHSKREKSGGTGVASTVSSRAAHDASQKANSFKESVEQIDEISRSMTPMRNRFGGNVDPKKFDTYKKHMKTHKLDEPTVRMIHQNPDDAESKRMMKNPKYAQAVNLYKNSMKESVELSENPMEEKPMMMNALRSMSHNIMGIARYVQSTQDPEEWFQNKLAGVAKEMQTLYSYATAEVMAMGEEVELDESQIWLFESQKAALAKELSKASATSEKGKKAVTLKKAPWDEQVDETTLSAIKKPINMTGPDGKTRTVYKSIKNKQYDDKGQDKIVANEEVEQIDEAFKPGIIKFKNNQSMILSKEDSDILNKMLKKLTSTNRKKMETIAMKDKKGFAEILEFAKEAM